MQFRFSEKFFGKEAATKKMEHQSGATQISSDTPIILYDGLCNLCTKSVQFVIQRDARKRFRFASLQSSFADTYVGKASQGQDRLKSMILIVGHQVYRQSTAALLTAKRLDGLWPILAVLLIIPPPIRDVVYQWIAKHRYQALGKKEECWRPTQELADRFLDWPNMGHSTTLNIVEGSNQDMR